MIRVRKRRQYCFFVSIIAGALGLWSERESHAASVQSQSGPTIKVGKPTSPSDPVTYLADHESYTKTGIATWSGNVQVWQGEHALRADKIVFNRNTGTLVATGHVAIAEPDGSAVYADRVELTNGMHDAIAKAVYVRMEDNAKLAANGLRRSAGKINEFGKVVYTACITCAKDPLLPPFWQIRAYNATQDMEHKRIEFSHAYLDLLGLPIFYFPLFSMSDPTVKRQSGFLTPGISPHDRYLGTYLTIPYYWAIDDQQDATIQGLVSTDTGPQIGVQYRNMLNFGRIRAIGAIAYSTHKEASYVNSFNNVVSSSNDSGIQGYIRANAEFNINRAWRGGINLNLASSANYMRDYRISGYGNETLSSDAYLEGFGVGSWTRIDGQYYQGLNQGVINNSQLPFVWPRVSYAFQAPTDPLGGTFSLSTTDFNVTRNDGVDTKRGQVQLNWNRPFENSWGQIFLFTARFDGSIYSASNLDEQPLYLNTAAHHVTGQWLPTAAIKMNWPFARTFGHGTGSQIFEPILQAIVAPDMTYSPTRYLPNEDSLQYEFTDSTLFSLNRYTGTDRLDGGIRANIGVHSNWTWRGHIVDILAGESIQRHVTAYRLPYSGLSHHLSSPVARIRFSPINRLDFTARGRYDPWRKRMEYGEGLINTGYSIFNINAGYVYEPVTPYYYYASNYRTGSLPSVYYRPMNELTAGLSARFRNYHGSIYGRRSLSRRQFVSLGGDVGYSNDCFDLDILAIKQYTFIGGQRRNTTILFNFTFKTIGTFGING